MKTVKGCDIDRGTTSSQMKTVKGCDIQGHNIKPEEDCEGL